MTAENTNDQDGVADGDDPTAGSTPGESSTGESSAGESSAGAGEAAVPDAADPDAADVTGTDVTDTDVIDTDTDVIDTDTDVIDTDGDDTVEADAAESGSGAQPEAGSRKAKRAARRERKAAERAAAAQIPDGALVRRETTRHWGVSLLLAVAVAALVGAVASVGYFSYTAVRAYVWEAPAATARDESVDVAEQTILNILQIDPKDTKGWQKRVESTLTGDAASQINDELVGGLQSQLQQNGQDQAATLRARISRSAVVELDTDENTAQVLVYAAVTPSNANQTEGETPMGFVVSVVKQGEHRKVNKIIPISAIVYQEAGN